MARRAMKTTYGIDTLTNPGGEDIEIRRKVVAGQMVPPGLDVPDGDVEDVEGTAPVGYRPHQKRGTEESDELLRSGVFGHEENVLPGDAEKDEDGEPVAPKGRRPAKTGATAAADRKNKDHNRVEGGTTT